MDYEILAHITSHDLRDPLIQARNYLNELIEKQQNNEDLEKLISIKGLTEEILEKIAIVRDFSYLSKNKEKFEEVDLDIIAREALGDFSKKINDVNASITIGKLPAVQGNARYLKRLFVYLIDNALKFSIPQIPPVIDIKAMEEGEFWHFAIEDNGIGIDEVYRELVFVLFQKLKASGKDSYGEGLAFAKKIVENHGGKIWYKSDGKAGTVFHFTIRK